MKIIIGEVKKGDTIDYDDVRFVLKTVDLAKFYKDRHKVDCTLLEYDDGSTNSYLNISSK